MKTEKEVLIPLAYPVQLADRMLTEVTMRRPTLGDELAHAAGGKPDLATEAKYFASLCALNPEDLKLLDMEDYVKLQQQYVCFLRQREV